jgi:hypothetical protein
MSVSNPMIHDLRGSVCVLDAKLQLMFHGGRIAKPVYEELVEANMKILAEVDKVIPHLRERKEKCMSKEQIQTV